MAITYLKRSPKTSSKDDTKTREEVEKISLPYYFEAPEPSNAIDSAHPFNNKIVVNKSNVFFMFKICFSWSRTSSSFQIKVNCYCNNFY